MIGDKSLRFWHLFPGWLVVFSLFTLVECLCIFSEEMYNAFPFPLFNLIILFCCRQTTTTSAYLYIPKLELQADPSYLLCELLYFQDIVCNFSVIIIGWLKGLKTVPLLSPVSIQHHTCIWNGYFGLVNRKFLMITWNLLCYFEYLWWSRFILFWKYYGLANNMNYLVQGLRLLLYLYTLQ